MSEHDEKPDAIAKTPDQIVGRTYADLVIHTQTGKKLDAAIARLAGWSIERVEVGAERVRRLFQRTDQLLEEGNVEQPKAIPERVGVEILENVAREDREELFEWWARLMVGSARGADIDAYHIDLVRKLDPHSARVFLAIGGRMLHRLSDKSEWDLIWEFMTSLANACDLPTQDEGKLACARLISLGLIGQSPKYSPSNKPQKMFYELSGFGEQLLKTLYPQGVAGLFDQGQLRTKQTSET